jgi:hypothetical protein
MANWRRKREGAEMDINRRIPHEQAKGSDDGLGTDDVHVVEDTEAHVHLTTDDLTVNPGTGGDFAPRRPSTGGEFIDENDVEGHAN